MTLMQRLIPEAVRGRAFGLMTTLMTVADPLGALAAGVFLHVLPLDWAWVLAALSGEWMAVAIWIAVPADLRASSIRVGAS